jgi:alpha-glucosidase
MTPPAPAQRPAMQPAATPWWKGAVLYQVYPRSFADSNGDGVGDLPGVLQHLDYIADLGVDGVWLSPFFRSPMKDFGYDISDYCDVDPIFGTLEDFDRLLARAHALGLKVIIDQVYSHTSDQHAWFRESRQDRTNPKADWYVWADAKPDGSPPSNWQSVFGGPAWTWDAARCQYYLHNFLPSQPDLNLHNPAVQDAVLRAAKFWLDRGVDGFRLDAVNFSMHDPALRDNPPAPPGRRTRPFDFQLHLYNQSHPDIAKFLERVRALTDSYGEARFTVAEVGGADADAEMKLYTADDRRLNSAYNFDFLYADVLTPTLVSRSLGAWRGGADEGWPSWAFSNHDAPRAVTRWALPEHRDAAARMSLMLLACLRGNIFLYYGDELGLPQADIPFEALQDPEALANWPLTLGRDGARTPMPWTAEEAQGGFSHAKPWLPMPEEHRRLAVSLQEADPNSLLQFTRRIIALRKAYPVLQTGAFQPLASDGDVLAFERRDGADRLLCVFNLSAEATAFPLPDGWNVIEGVNGWCEKTGALPGYAGFIAERG